MKESFMKNRTGILIMLASSFFACIGQLFWKMSYEKGVYLLLSGFFFYAVGALLMLVAYKYGSLSVLQPMLSMNYVISIFFASFFLGEHITIPKIIGVIIIIAGVIMIGGGDD